MTKDNEVTKLLRGKVDCLISNFGQLDTSTP